MTAWTPTEDKLARDLWGAGLSAAEIGSRLGRPRNAVLGRLHRTKSETPERAEVPKYAKPIKNAAAKGNIGKACEAAQATQTGEQPSQAGFQVGASEGAQPPAGARAVTGPGVDDLTPTFGLVTLFELEPQMCKWPFGQPSTPEYRQCGRPQHGGYGPYCKHHFEMAYTPRGRRVVE
jgi:GcrA cell cycle regulator